jgi:hypothetical protein
MSLDEAIRAAADAGKSFASPAKIAFIGYVVLVYKGAITATAKQFFWVAGAFCLIQAIHDDYLRIWLNRLAERRR